jgi:hypothetical protein
LSPNRALIRFKSSKFRIAVCGPALALLAMTGAAAGASSAGVWSATTASATTGPAAPAHSIALDAFSASAGSPKSAQPSVSGGTASGGGKAKRKSTAKAIAWRMLGHLHWSAHRQYRDLNRLWTRESGWNIHASNPSSGAYGIPQAVPGSKMASAGSHWQSSARTQIRWGLRYIRDRYGSPRQAWFHETSVGWY